MAIRVSVAGAIGWAGSAVAGAILASSDFPLVGAITRQPCAEISRPAPHVFTWCHFSRIPLLGSARSLGRDPPLTGQQAFSLRTHSTHPHAASGCMWVHVGAPG
jgi:hypothetical protein